MGSVSVDQILVTPLRRIPLDEGDVLHAMKQSDAGYVGFGEAYFSMIKQGSIKAWKRHLKMTLNLVAPLGKVRFVFVDDAGGVREEFAGENRYVRLTVPPSIWFGFQGLVAPQSMLLNIADISHEPEEIERKKLEEINFSW
jgi:dTDP-4-dehydrorhamnose 3,5-epimerase